MFFKFKIFLPYQIFCTFFQIIQKFSSTSNLLCYFLLTYIIFSNSKIFSYVNYFMLFFFKFRKITPKSNNNHDFLYHTNSKIEFKYETIDRNADRFMCYEIHLLCFHPNSIFALERNSFGHIHQ